MNRLFTPRVRQRLLMALPTLVGVSLVTFALLHLIPGEPGDIEKLTAKHGISAEMLQENRRLLGLDLPLFFNLEPRDLSWTLRRALLDGRDAPARHLGTALVPHLDHLQSLGIQTAASRKLMRSLLEKRGWRLDGGFDNWWPRVGASFKAPRMRQLIARLPGSGPQLLKIGRYATPWLVDALEGPQGTVAANLLARINRKPYRLEADDSPTRRRSVIRRWRDFADWQQTQLAVSSGAPLVWRMLSETQYGRWLNRLTTLDFGYSLTERVPVGELLRRYLPITLILGTLALVLAFLFGIPLGVWHALYRQRWPGHLIAGLMVFLFAMPSYWLATLLIQIFAGALEWFPAMGLSSADPPSGTLAQLADRVHHLIMPLFVLTYGILVLVSRYTTTSMARELQLPYLRTARAKGCTRRRAIWRHAVLNSSIAIISLGGLLVPTILGGSIIVEKLFDIPGMGLLTFRAIQTHDYPTVMAVVTLSSLLTIAGLLLSDLLHSLVDPRMAGEVEG